MEIFPTLPKEQQELIIHHLQQVIAANSRINLTRIDTPEEGILLHIEDSLSALPEFQNAPSGLYGDLGSGGGYPGIPLAIVSGRDTVLIDARQKKMITLQSIIDTLGLSDKVKTFGGRAELLARKQPQKFSVLTARALARLSVLLELASPLLCKNGQLICYKANLDDQELFEAKQIEKETGMKLVSDRKLKLNEEIPRRILVFEKYKNPSIKLPRQEGMAQKNPL